MIVGSLRSNPSHSVWRLVRSVEVGALNPAALYAASSGSAGAVVVGGVVGGGVGVGGGNLEHDRAAVRPTGLDVTVDRRQFARADDRNVPLLPLGVAQVQQHDGRERRRFAARVGGTQVHRDGSETIPGMQELIGG